MENLKLRSTARAVGFIDLTLSGAELVGVMGYVGFISYFTQFFESRVEEIDPTSFTNNTGIFTLLGNISVVNLAVWITWMSATLLCLFVITQLITAWKLIRATAKTKEPLAALQAALAWKNVCIVSVVIHAMSTCIFEMWMVLVIGLFIRFIFLFTVWRFMKEICRTTCTPKPARDAI